MRSDGVRDALEVLDIDSRDDVIPASSNSSRPPNASRVVPIPARWCGELVDEHHLRASAQHAIEVHLFEDASMLDHTTRSTSKSARRASVTGRP